MKTRIHAIAGSIAILTVLGFWSATLVVELFLTEEAVESVKKAIVLGLFFLIPTLAATGASGAVLSRGCKASVANKQKRMALIAANGLLFMLPLALYLNAKASAGEFDTAFYAAQVAELLAGALQLSLMGMNFRDGRRLRNQLGLNRQQAAEQ